MRFLVKLGLFRIMYYKATIYTLNLKEKYSSTFLVFRLKGEERKFH